jgi:hypothetical protein
MLKSLLMTLPVVIPAVAFYLWVDPFMTVSRDADYFPDPDRNPARIGVNKGMATLRTYERRRAEGRRYNAFIFGSSISCTYDVREWRRLLGGDEGADVRPFHFDSSSETLTQMAEKVEYLDSKGDTIRYALIILDPIVMGGESSDAPYAVDPLELHPNPLYFLKFHYTFLRASTNADFFKSWLPAKIYGKPFDNGRNHVFNPQPIVYDPATNQESLSAWDSLITDSPVDFYRRYPLVESPPTATESRPLLVGERGEALKRIAEIFRAQHTDCRIIIGPNRRKVTLSRGDREWLYTVFGAGRVHDFSLILCRELERDTLLYDNTHYRPVFATRMMRLVYGRQTE